VASLLLSFPFFFSPSLPLGSDGRLGVVVVRYVALITNSRLLLVTCCDEAGIESLVSLVSITKQDPYHSTVVAELSNHGIRCPCRVPVNGSGWATLWIEFCAIEEMQDRSVHNTSLNERSKLVG